MKALSPIAVLISALLLQGCVAAAVVGTAAVGTKAATDPRSVGTQVDDGTLEVRVNSALSKDEQIKKEARINVTAYQGKVLLVGQSPNAELSARAKQIAMGVDGANEVYNEIRQGQPIGLGEASNDTWITTKVRSQLLTSDLVKSSNVKVTTENGEVFLMGLVMRRLPRLIRPTTMQTVGRIRRLRRIRHVFPQIRTTAPARRQSHQTLPPSPLSAIRLSPGTLCAA